MAEHPLAEKVSKCRGEECGLSDGHVWLCPENSQYPFVVTFNLFASLVYETAKSKGWYDKPREDGTMIALMHSELSEALEGLRHGNPPCEKMPEFSSAEEEMADTVIRIMDMAAHKGWRLGEAIAAKAEFNKGRAYKHGGKEF